MKVVINRCWGGFGLSHEGVLKYAELKGITLYTCVENGNSFSGRYEIVTGKEKENSIMGYTYLTEPPDDDGTYEEGTWWWDHEIERHDPALAETVETLGSEVASGHLAALDVVEIPDGVMYTIDDYDGQESIHEEHRSW